MAVINKEMSQRRAALQFNVPRQTIRDRIIGKIDPECVTTGRSPVFSLEEEARIVDHIKEMASFGYGYTRQEVTDLGTDFAHCLNKKPPNESLTLRWFEGLMRRWPELKVTRPRSLEVQRAKCGTVDNVKKYFSSLEEVVDRYNLKDKPHLIFNVDEKGLTSDHKPPSVVAGIDCTTSEVTSGRSSTTTVLGCGNASGFAIPPYFVFEGKRMIPELMNGATPGAAGTVSDSGWSNTKVFKKYLSEHFLNFIPGRKDEYVLLLLDGHKSHVAVDIIEWAQERKVILHILPAHTSHILQPLDVGCYGPLQRIYDNECHKSMRANHSVITRYNVCELGCKAYQKALSPENLQSAFRKTGIFPLTIDIINKDLLKPSEVFKPQENQNTEPDTAINLPTESMETEDVPMETTEQTNHQQHAPENETEVIVAPQFFAQRISALRKVKSENPKKERNTLGKVVSGMPITEAVIAEKVRNHVENQGKGKGKSSKGGHQEQQCKKSSTKSQKHENVSSKPGPSYFYIEDSMDNSETDDDAIQEEEKCCVCKQFTPKEIRNGVGLEFTKWVQCENENCRHWTHVKYCTKLKAVRRDTRFYCMHCEDDQ